MQIPLFKPQTEWVKPEKFPDLTNRQEVAIDLETSDPDLKTKGSGSIIGNGKVVGIAVASESYQSYFPFDHEGGGNLQKKKVIQWLSDLCKSSSLKIFHNSMYDVCWIRAMGIEIKGDVVDTMIAASLINENRMRYDLNSLGREYVGYGKDETTLIAGAKEWGINP